MRRWRIYVFFCQAEEGIRDIGVTGVQTCALPIYAFENGFGGIKLNNKWGIIDKQGKIVVTPKFDMNIVNPDFVKQKLIPVCINKKWGVVDNNFKEMIKPKIGRASCRERV